MESSTSMPSPSAAPASTTLAASVPPEDEFCVATLHQTAARRAAGLDPTTRLRCFQRRRNSDGSIDLVFVSTSDFIVAVKEIASLADDQATVVVVDDDAKAAAAAGSKASQNADPESASSQSADSSSNADKSSKMVPLVLPPPSRKSMKDTMRAVTQPQTYTDLHAYLRRIFAPHARFVKRARESIANGGALVLVRKFGKSVFVDGLPLAIVRKGVEKWQTWISRAWKWTNAR